MDLSSACVTVLLLGEARSAAYSLSFAKPLARCWAGASSPWPSPGTDPGSPVCGRAVFQHEAGFAPALGTGAPSAGLAVKPTICTRQLPPSPSVHPSIPGRRPGTAASAARAARRARLEGGFAEGYGEV